MAIYLKGKLARYPAQKRMTREWVYGSSFMSVAQQHFFFWALKAGEISVPYHRGESGASERFGASWTVEEADDGLTQVIGNDTSYGPFLMGEDQSDFMQAIGWQKAELIADEEEDTIVNGVMEAIEEMINE
jgi:hypothetical protein